MSGSGGWSFAALSDVQFTASQPELSKVAIAALKRIRATDPDFVVLADPAVHQCFEATALAHGVEICPADDDVMEDADERAEQIKSMLATVQAKIDKLSCSSRASRPLSPAKTNAAQGNKADTCGNPGHWRCKISAALRMAERSKDKACDQED